MMVTSVNLYLSRSDTHGEERIMTTTITVPGILRGKSEDYRQGFKSGVREATHQWTPMERRNERTDGEHPSWCEPDGTCTELPEGRDPYHEGRLTQFFATYDAARISLRLVHSEDRDRVTRDDHGTTALKLEIANLDTPSADGTPQWASVQLTETDARMLAQALAGYIDVLGRRSSDWVLMGDTDGAFLTGTGRDAEAAGGPVG